MEAGRYTARLAPPRLLATLPQQLPERRAV
jgi:hypothetical protein